MAKDNIRMPSSTAGITSYSDEIKGVFHFPPSYVVAIIIISIILVAALHYVGRIVWGS